MMSTTFANFRPSLAMRVPVGTICTAVLMFAVGCGDRSVTPSPSFEVVASHEVADGVVLWDPNSEPALVLSVRGSSDDPALAGVWWTQTGWGVDLWNYHGPDLRIDVNQPGCGYGGLEFEITAHTADASQSHTMTIRMARYLCPGSPWND